MGCDGKTHERFTALNLVVRQAMRLYRALVFILIATLLIVLPAHFILLASDSSEYRVMVCVQVAVLAVLTGLLWLARNLSRMACAGVVGFGFIATYLNAVYLNYGNGLRAWFFPICIMLLYAGIALWATQKVKHA